MEPTAQQIQELRTKFLQKLEQQTPESGGVHPADLAKIKNGDAWLRRFLTHNDCDMKETLDMLWESVDWRNRVGANEITESSINRNFLEGGVLFVRSKDKDGKPLLILKVKKHSKNHGDAEGLRKYVIYWFERLERLTKGDQVTLFFDMADAGLSNLDMDLIKYLIGMFKTNYPYFLNFILVFEMPWVMNAAFKIIKSMLPAKGVERLRVVNKSNLKEYVDPENALKCWGGKDDYEFVFESEQLPPPKSGRGDDTRKKVTFAENSHSDMSGDARNDMKASDSMYSGSNLVSISPSDFLNFVNDGSNLMGTITLTNISDGCISYKIKTTTPDKFRVRPSTGTLTAGSTVNITIILQHGYPIPAYSRDRFLVMCLPIESSSLDSQELSELWKQCNGKNVEQHPLRCNLGSGSWPADSPARSGSSTMASSSADVDKQLANILRGVNELKEAQKRMHGELKWTKRLQWFSVIFIVVLASLAYYWEKNTVPDDVCYPHRGVNYDEMV
ncbi:motile sperm domain-containing protein 2-like [Ischnura elegans]|uniref:motile sperm domain-containing protein 2-like n=1 Tax=Ischnura elegans TaxID=197161 RepID=UPI001ED8B644|nr:motile sperm domain-containing protein 2-like [Ischnura elegans]XP_046390063.1 motile sperm domain-containing protein 2-like [Ischnura elegans]